MIKVSVIVPVYNAEKYLDASLKSLMDQTLKEIEIICIDDGSSDDSAKIIEKYKRESDNFHYISYGCNRGQAYARNIGIENAKGKYIFFMDSDDLLPEPDTLKKLYAVSDNYNVDIHMFEATVIYETENLRKEFGNLSLTMNCLPNEVITGKDAFNILYANHQFRPVVWQELWNRDFLNRYSLRFEEKTSPHEDMLFTFEAMLKADNVIYKNYFGYVYRCREGSSTSAGYNFKRYCAHVLCYCKAMEYLEALDYCSEDVEGLLAYINGIKVWLRDCHVQYSKENGIDDFLEGNPKYQLYFRLLLTEKYYNLRRIFNAEEHQLLANNKIIVYGLGLVGKDVMSLLHDSGYTDYKKAVTKKNDPNIKDVYEIKDLKHEAEESIVIVAVIKRYQKEMIQTLSENGFKKYIVLC